MSNNQLPSTINRSANPNTHFAYLFVSALAQSGLRHVVIAPGSRSTPLTLAFAAQDAIAVHLHVDERSGGFFALGIALATDQPVALVCTSGTAVANFFPALIEANMSQVPLLLLTADRPHELRHSGANQTIDQVKIYGDQVLWSVDMPVPQADAPAVLTRHVETLAARAYATANGLRKGPVHVNFPFRKPLQAENDEGGMMNDEEAGRKMPVVARIARGEIILSRGQEQELAELINGHERGLIICGPRCPGGNFPQAVAGLSQMSGYPILADPLSGVRWGRHASSSVILGGYESFMQHELDWPEPEVIIRFGAVPTSKWLNAYLDRVQPQQRIHIRENGVWADDSHRITHFIQAKAENVCYQVSQSLYPRLSSDWLNQVSATETAVWQSLQSHLFEPYIDASIVADVVELLPLNSSLLVGNSLPIRHVDQFGRPSPKFMRVFGNRGASGIDGNLSTGLGIATALQRPTAILVGDITFLHDLNGLFPLANHDPADPNSSGRIQHSAFKNVTIVLLNNNGGGIFNRLPISQIDPPFTELFRTPHGLDFEPAVRMMGLAFTRPQNRQQFRDTFAAGLQDNLPRVIEMQTDGEQDNIRRQEIIRALAAHPPDTL